MKKTPIIFKTCFEIFKHLHMFLFFFIDLKKFLKVKISRKENLLVAVPLSLDLPEDVDPVVVAQGAGHLVIVHGQVVLLDTPQPKQQTFK